MAADFTIDMLLKNGVAGKLIKANEAWDVRLWSTVEFQFTAGTVTVTRSLDGVNYVSWPVYDSSGAAGSSAATPGIYSTDGFAFIKFSADVVARAGD